MSGVTQTQIEPRRTPKQRRSAETIGYILRASVKIIEEDGFAGLNTTQVARVAGVSPGTLYQYFPNKESLITALIEESAQQEIAVMEQTFGEMENEKIGKVLETLIRNAFAFHAQFPKLYKVIHEELQRLGRDDKVHQYEFKAIEIMENFLGLRRIEIQVSDLHKAAFIVVYTIENLIRTAFLVKPTYITDDFFHKEIIRMLTLYLGVKED